MNQIKNFILFILLCFSSFSYAQLTNGITGLLHMPNAEMQKDGTVLIGGNYLNKNNLPSKWWWGYDTYNYFINITILDRIEVSYICTLVKGQESISYWPQQTWGKFVNQDRQFAGKIQLIKEGEWWKYMPAIVIGVNDPTTGGTHDYTEGAVSGRSNGYFNRYFAAITKHFYFNRIGEFGVHATYLKNKRTDYPLNGIAVGINFRPDFHKNLNVIIEHDTKTLNIGAIYSLWADHFNFLFELQDGKYVSCGLVYKVNLKGNNRWKSGIFDY